MQPNKSNPSSPERGRELPFKRYQVDINILAKPHNEIAKDLLQSCQSKGIKLNDVLFAGFAGRAVASKGFGRRQLTYAVTAKDLLVATDAHDRLGRAAALTDPLVYADRDGGSMPAIGVFRTTDLMPAIEHPDCTVSYKNNTYGELILHGEVLESPDNCYTVRPGLESLDQAAEAVYFFVDKNRRLGKTALS